MPGLEAPIKFSVAEGMQEITSLGGAFLIFRPVYNTAPFNTFQMIEEASTKFPGATARQVTLNQRTTGGPLLAETSAVLAALEEADADGMVNLRGVGVRDIGAGFGATATFSFRSTGLYTNDAGTLSLSRAELIAEAQAGALVMTFTGALRSGYGVDPQPLLSPPSTGGCSQCGDPAIPVITSTAADPPAFNVTGVKLTPDASVVWDGAGITGATQTRQHHFGSLHHLCCVVIPPGFIAIAIVGVQPPPGSQRRVGAQRQRALPCRGPAFVPGGAERQKDAVAFAQRLLSDHLLVKWKILGQHALVNTGIDGESAPGILGQWRQIAQTLGTVIPQQRSDVPRRQIADHQIGRDRQTALGLDCHGPAGFQTRYA